MGAQDDGPARLLRLRPRLRRPDERPGRVVEADEVDRLRGRREEEAPGQAGDGDRRQPLGDRSRVGGRRSPHLRRPPRPARSAAGGTGCAGRFHSLRRRSKATSGAGTGLRCRAAPRVSGRRRWPTRPAAGPQRGRRRQQHEHHQDPADASHVRTLAHPAHRTQAPSSGADDRSDPRCRSPRSPVPSRPPSCGLLVLPAAALAADGESTKLQPQGRRHARSAAARRRRRRDRPHDRRPGRRDRPSSTASRGSCARSSPPVRSARAAPACSRRDAPARPQPLAAPGARRQRGRPRRRRRARRRPGAHLHRAGGPRARPAPDDDEPTTTRGGARPAPRAAASPRRAATGSSELRAPDGAQVKADGGNARADPAAGRRDHADPGAAVHASPASPAS